ncbi:hypothetical protein ACN27J_15005 [Solwaraspora sp. WMMB762]|uniref:hypothetical protein n=1 Tax=Solwaraspora sp. WMMB762 TaxID=3404120 RepID=UPI003B934894
MAKYVRRICVATDIELYTGRTNPEQEEGQGRLIRMIDYACRRAGLTGVARQRSGDGQILVLRPGIDEARVVPTLILGLRHALYENNRDPGMFGRIRLRTAICQGVVADSSNGWVGQAVVAAARLINSAQVRAALAERSQVDLALAVPDDLYEDVVRQHHPGLQPGQFRQIVVKEKNYSSLAWLHSPEPGPTADPSARRVPWLPIGAAFGVGAVGGALVGAGRTTLGSGGTPGLPPSRTPGHGTPGHGQPGRTVRPTAAGWHPAAAEGVPRRPEDDPDDDTGADTDILHDSTDDAVDGLDGIL